MTVHLAPDDGVFELAGESPTWIWAHTCPTPKCPCRTALVAATREGREALLARGASIRDAWNAGSSYADAAAEVEGLIVFSLNIDSGAAYGAGSRVRLNLAEHPEVRAVVERLDGDLLDSLGRLWFKGKGLPDPEAQAQRATEVVMHGWKPGDMVAWSDVLTGVRADLYLVGDRTYEASEMYCLVPDCNCGEVFVGFDARQPRGGPPVGSVTIERSGNVKFEPYKGRRAQLEALWSAFAARHPRYRERFQRRHRIMKSLGARIAMSALVPAASARVPAASAVDRNDPCPCGSGKKFKKCCIDKARTAP
jgi:hypothetical protein